MSYLVCCMAFIKYLLMIDFQYLNHQNMNLGQLHGSVCNYIYTVWLGISVLYITIQLWSETC